MTGQSAQHPAGPYRKDQYPQEQFTGLTGTAGNGNGIQLDGGTVSLLTP